MFSVFFLAVERKRKRERERDRRLVEVEEEKKTKPRRSESKTFHRCSLPNSSRPGPRRSRLLRTRTARESSMMRCLRSTSSAPEGGLPEGGGEEGAIEWEEKGALLLDRLTICSHTKRKTNSLQLFLRCRRRRPGLCESSLSFGGKVTRSRAAQEMHWRTRPEVNWREKRGEGKVALLAYKMEFVPFDLYDLSTPFASS